MASPDQAEQHAGVLEVLVRDGPGEVVLALVGEADLGTASILETALGAVAANGHRRVVLDLGGLGFIDASCLNILATAQRALEQQDTQFVVRAPSPSVVRLLGIFGWESWLDSR